MVYCVICDQKSEDWIPHPQRAQRSEFMKAVGAVGSNLQRYMCPKCGCNDRDRHVWLYLCAAGIASRINTYDILHFAPEHHIELWIHALSPRSYIGCDLYPKNPNHVRVDCENIQFGDASFDLIIFNHILEHVSSPERALSELMRCLKPGGILIAQTPFSPELKYTFELDTVPTQALCGFFYGQEDHVRLFGKDIVNYFLSAGLKGDLFAHERVLPNIDPVEHGCNEKEPFFFFSKEPCQPFPF